MPRPSIPILSRDRIAQAALKLARERGGFTVQAVAAELGVNAASLYHHVPGGRTEIMVLVRAAIHEEVEIDDLRDRELPWRERLIEWADRYREITVRSSAVLPVLFGQAIQDRPTLAIYDTLFQILADAGVPEGKRLDAGIMIDLAVLGSAVDEGSASPLWRNIPEDLEQIARMSEVEPAEGRPSSTYRMALEAAADMVEKLARQAGAQPVAD